MMGRKTIHPARLTSRWEPVACKALGLPAFRPGKKGCLMSPIRHHGVTAVACVFLFFFAPRLAAAEPLRVVFLGDSITDGNTYPLLIRQALQEAGKPAPVCINAGVGGDTAEAMGNRIERDVLVHKPSVAALSAGITDALQKVPAA